MSEEQTLPALIVKVEGRVLETNIDAYRDTALDYVKAINTALNTDDDFADAEGVVKWCSAAEKKIKSVKAQAMEQASDINAVFSALDEVSAALRDKRLDLNKQVKAQKEERKQDALDKTMADLVAYTAGLQADLEQLKLSSPQDYASAFAGAAKGKKTLKGLQKALDKSLEAAKSSYAKSHQIMRANLQTLAAHKEHAFLFADAQEHATKPTDEFQQLVTTRIAEHDAAEKERLEREREAMRVEVREQERAKLEEQAASAARAVEVEAEPPEPVLPAATSDSPHVHHTIDYVEIGALDLAAAKTFYGAAFGWQFKDHGPDFSGIVGEGPERAGLAKVDSPGTGGAWIVLYSTQLDQTAADVVKAGGRITKEIFKSSGGRQFHFADPTGNEMAVWSDR